MYKVLFNGVTVALCGDDTSAIGLAINLHKSSNVEHKVNVLFEDDLILNLYAPIPSIKE